jgi:hypothetical protein
VSFLFEAATLSPVFFWITPGFGSGKRRVLVGVPQEQEVARFFVARRFLRFFPRVPFLRTPGLFFFPLRRAANFQTVRGAKKKAQGDEIGCPPREARRGSPLIAQVDLAGARDMSGAGRGCLTFWLFNLRVSWNGTLRGRVDAAGTDPIGGPTLCK